ncbi:MAG TPA: EAL domain-containing protein [Alphaproteobacteria bacterium]|nr:EAL domain-containing protein [Alphaproteobacteria bacterium]
MSLLQPDDAKPRLAMAVGQDDEAFAAIEAALADSGFGLCRAASVAEAVSAVAHRRAQVLIVDFATAGEGGPVDLIQLVGLFLTVPAVVLLESLRPATAVELVKLGAQDVLLADQIGEGRLSAALECAVSRAQIAHHDHLTGLPNRGLLFDRLDHAIAQARRYRHQLAVLFVDLDHFKFVNDSMGHEAGDGLLKVVAGRIRDCLRESDTVARLGGDEFIALVTNLQDGADAAAVAGKVIEQLSQPVQINGTAVSAMPSIGIAIYPDDAANGEELIRLADAAMYQAKQKGGCGYQFYRPDLNSDALRRIGLGVALQRAIRHDELELHYQPQLDVVSGLVVGLEALVRWRHPERGLVPPDQFIPLAEDLGLMESMGRWILGEACRQLRAWRDDGLTAPRMAINLSPHQFSRDNLLQTILRGIEEAGLEAGDVELELTEGSVMSDPDQTVRTLLALSEAGVGLAIDDFGTGYSSLAYLKRFPLDVLKIDRSFVRDVTTDSSDAAIVKTIIGLARHFGLRVIAEGAEDEQQLLFLRANGCRLVQGFHIARPVPAAEVPALVGALHERYATPAQGWAGGIL